MDTDGDGMSNRQEWLSGTDPTRADSVLSVLESDMTGLGIMPVNGHMIPGTARALARG